MDGSRASGLAVTASSATLGLALRFEPERDPVEQLERHLKEKRGVAALQLELQPGHRFRGAAVNRMDLPLIEHRGNLG
jgi:hypothetical protein